MILYIFFQVILFLLNIILNFNNVFFKLLPIIINLLFIAILTKKINKNILLLFLFVFIADITFSIGNNCISGIAIFTIVQYFYYLIIKNKKINYILLLILFLNVILTMFSSVQNLKIFEVILYVGFSIYNIIQSTFKNKNKYILTSLILLFLCDICIGLKDITATGIFNTIEYLFYFSSQTILLMYYVFPTDSFAYRLLQPIFTFIFKIYYNPKIINKEYIPKKGAAVIAGNHKHALDPILVDVCTKRVVHTLAKKGLHDGKFGCFFRAIGTIPVDLKAKHNKQSLTTAIEYLNNDSLINVSPEAKRNYTEEILLPFKVGAVVMAQRTNCKIVPYSITGDYKFRSKNLKITFGKPLDVSEMTVEEANELLFKKVKKLLVEARK